MKILALLAILALAVGGQIGCVTSSTVTDGDRQVLHQGVGALEGAVADLEGAQAKVAKGSEAWTMIGLGLAKLADLERGAAHLQEVHGPPKEPKEYSTENMTAAIAQSKEEHAGGGIGGVLYTAGGVAAGLAAAWFGMPWIARLFPSRTGIVGRVADTGVQIVTAIRKQAEESGGSITVKDILKTAKEYVVSAGVEGVVGPKAAAFEEQLGYKPVVKLEETPPPAPPAVAPALAP